VNDRRRRWTFLRFVPRRRLALAAALVAPLWLLSGTPVGLAVAAVAAGALALAAVVDAMLTAPAKRVVVERDAPATIGVGDHGDVTYRVASRWPGRLAVRLFHRMPAGTVDPRPGVAPRLLVPPVGVAEDRRAIIGGARGRHPLGEVVLRVEGPLGLVERSVRFALGDHVLVTPSLAGVRRYRLLALQRRLRDAGIRTVRLRGEGTSFASLRAYSVGDDPRHIDWKATAKRRMLISREYAVEQGQTVMIIIDAGRMMTQMAGTLSRFEHVLASALTLADVAASGDDRVGLMIFDDEVRAFVPPIRGRAALPPIRDALVPATARLVEPDYAAAFRTLAARHRKRSLLVIFTDVVDRRASSALIAHTGRSAARHLPLIVALRNDQLVGATVPPPDAGAATLYETAAAEELVIAREEALHGMRQMGIDVIDTSPRVMTASVINRYLEIKARASL
jgi:uncharacterized protein (DUF58 family)